ncbi:putative NAD-binding protein [Lyophyllum shimeji]|uniref:NAD-binding protein n=1 Tax=Lyophyllum shimeji TaxID=47721 RepID=A0A9P3URM8_LYOSH|nr:putative NAD-binding protein [Lyophyllum shimeji]
MTNPAHISKTLTCSCFHFRHLPRAPNALWGVVPPSRAFSRRIPPQRGGKLSLPTRTSPLAPLGVTAALQAKKDPSIKPRSKIFDEFSLRDRVGLVSGANQGLGLEMALALCEAGARVVYCLDRAAAPAQDWHATREYVERMANGSRLEYVSCDVTDQQRVWKIGEEIGDKEGRFDIGVATAGVPSLHINCLDYPHEQLRKVLDVNTCGALFTAQAAGRQMTRFNMSGSIILIASMSGSITNRGHAWVSYNSSKAAVIQMARSMACELGDKGIRVNSVSPGHIFTNMSAAELETRPQLLDIWSDFNPLRRIGTTDEFRGVITWLASDASSFCTGSEYAPIT